jgi:hypothetical protein
VNGGHSRAVEDLRSRRELGPWTNLPAGQACWLGLVPITCHEQWPRGVAPFTADPRIERQSSRSAVLWRDTEAENAVWAKHYRPCACLRWSAMCSRPALSRCWTNSCIGGCTLRYGFLLCPVNSPPPGPVESPPPGPVDRPPPGPADSPPPGPVDIPPPGPVDSPPPGPVDSPPPGPVDIPPPGPVEAPPPGPVESPPHRRVDNPPPLPVDRSRGQPLAFMPAMLRDSTATTADAGRSERAQLGCVQHRCSLLRLLAGAHRNPRDSR